MVGDLVTSSVVIGSSSTNVGTATVTGAGSTWTTDALTLGDAGSGTLTASSGALVEVNGGTGPLAIARQAGSTGTLNIGALDLSATAGTISANGVAFGAGTGIVNFNQTDAISFAAPITGAGKVQQRGNGTTTLTSANTYTGGTTISGGTLALGASNRLADTGTVHHHGRHVCPRHLQ